MEKTKKFTKKRTVDAEVTEQLLALFVFSGNSENLASKNHRRDTWPTCSQAGFIQQV